MLSRIAESLFWMARYMERAEDTARLLDVHFHTLLEQSQQTYLLRWDSIIRISGDHEQFFGVHPHATPQTVFEFLGFRDSNPNSIVACITRVRENARTIRDRISREMWEDINSFYHRIRSFRADSEILAGPHRFCNDVKLGSHRFRGVADDTLPHDEGWQFLRAGRALERAEKTARIVDVEYHTLLEGRDAAHQPDNHQWMAVLKSVAAYEIYRREFHASIDPRKVAELLVLHPRHPRSIRFNIAELHASLKAISQSAPGTYASEAERLTGKLHETFLYDRMEDIFERGLHSVLRDVQHTCRSIGEQIARTYFYYAVV
jgi:uncharacterized alpha-E superfamily protein